MTGVTRRDIFASGGDGFDTLSGGEGDDTLFGGDSGASAGDDDLKSREYKDAQGNAHHHTKAYMEQHSKK